MNSRSFSDPTGEADLPIGMSLSAAGYLAALGQDQLDAGEDLIAILEGEW